MSLHFRKQLTAWLGLVAMCLIVLAPVVSQWVVAAQHGNAPLALCSAASASRSASTPASVVSTNAVRLDAPAMHQHGDPLAACGYCDLMADHPAIPSLPMLPIMLFALVCSVSVAALANRYVPLGAFSLARPRAPPLHDFALC